MLFGSFLFRSHAAAGDARNPNLAVLVVGAHGGHDGCRDSLSGRLVNLSEGHNWGWTSRGFPRALSILTSRRVRPA